MTKSGVREREREREVQSPSDQRKPDPAAGLLRTHVDVPPLCKQHLGRAIRVTAKDCRVVLEAGVAAPPWKAGPWQGLSPAAAPAPPGGWGTKPRLLKHPRTLDMDRDTPGLCPALGHTPTPHLRPALSSFGVLTSPQNPAFLGSLPS